MPSERILIGGGTGYDNSSVESKYRSYYQFRTYDIYEIVGNPQVRNGTLLATYSNDGDVRISNTYTILTNRLFTGVLPYTDPYDKNYYCQTLNLPPLVPNYLPALSTYNAANEIFFTFGLPVTLTKYRIWNGFANGTSGQTSANMGLDTPRSWVLYGSNDYINWTEVDSRSNQSPLSYATGKLCKDSPYSEYLITAPSAYKIYKLSVTVGASNSALAFNCNKSGCNYFYGWQIGELQLWGYESPTSSCSLHGYDTLLPGTSGSMSKLFGLKNACKEVGINEGFSAAPNNDNSSYLSRSWEYFGDWTYEHPDYSILGQNRILRGDNIETNTVGISASIDMGQALTITSYKILGGYNTTYQGGGDASPRAWTLYGSNDNSTWTTIDSRTNASLTYTSYLSYSVGSPASYRYYKIEAKPDGGGFPYGCGKDGCRGTIKINDFQLVGYIT